MAVTYAIDNSNTTYGPATVLWRQMQIGTDHNGAPIFSQNWEVDLSFPAGSISTHKEWTDAVDGASHILDIPGRDTLGFVTLSPVWLRYQSRPALDSVISGTFVITVARARDNT